MADIVNSLFGLSTNDIQQKRNEEFKAFQTSMVNNARGAKAKVGASLGAGIGAGLGKAAAGWLGIQDPELERASKLEGILKETQQESSGDEVETFSILAKKLNDAGFSREAMQVQGQLEGKVQAKQLNEAKVFAENAQGAKYKAEALKALREDDPNQKVFLELAKNSSPQAVARAIKAGYDVGLLDSPEKTKLSGYGQQLVDAGYKVGTPEFESKMKAYLDAELTGKSKGSGNVSVNVGGIAIDSGKVSEEAGKIVGKEAAAIEEQYAQLGDFKKAKELLDNGIFSGQYGGVEMQVAKSTRQNLKKVANTERFKAFISSNVIKRLKDIGGNDTKEERDYLESMIGGDITYEPEAIRSVIESGEQKIRDKIARTKQQVNSAATGSSIPLDELPKVTEGQTGVSKSGKSMIVKNGKWVYK